MDSLPLLIALVLGSASVIALFALLKGAIHVVQGWDALSADQHHSKEVSR